MCRGMQDLLHVYRYGCWVVGHADHEGGCRFFPLQLSHETFSRAAPATAIRLNKIAEFWQLPGLCPRGFSWGL